MKHIAAGLVLLLVVGGYRANASVPSACSVFLLKEAEGGVGIEVVSIDEGTVNVFSIGAGSENIAVLLPFGPGQSGEVVQRTADPFVDVVRCVDSEISVTVRKSDGSERELPPVSMAEWAGYDMRVNVTGANGPEAVFMIRKGQIIEAAAGPVINMFGGMIPLQQGDYAITTEVTPHTDASHVEGKAPLVFDGRHLFTRGHVGGAAGSFIVDVGAGSTVVTEEFLPEGTSIARLKGVEYSDHGTRIVDGSAGGLGGTVESFLGKAVLPVLTIGSVTFHDVSVSVISDMPSFDGNNPVGILGLDLLSRADQVSIQYESDEASLIWENGDSAVGEASVEIPFTMAGNHVFIEGRIDGTPVSLVLDTGARLSMIPSPLAREAAMARDGSLETLRGLDGTPVEVSATTADQFTLGEAEFSDVVFYVGDFAVLESWGLQGNGGILGNDFLQRFREVRFDFRNQIVRFILH